jgi:Na+-driven multidrug efflux pump
LIATLIGLTGQMSWLYYKNSPLLLRRSEWNLLRFDRDILDSLVTRGLPMGAQLLVASSANVAVISVVNGYGVLTSAAYGAATVIWTYVQMPLTATGLSVSAMGAQNVGARKWDRVDLIGHAGVKIGLAFTGLPIALIFLLHRPLMSLFLPAGSPSIDIAMEIDTYVLPGYLIMSVAFVYNSVVRATGAVWPPLLCFIVAFWLIRVPVASFGSPYFGEKAIWLSFPVCAVIATIFSYGYYRFGNWRKARLLHAS